MTLGSNAAHTVDDDLMIGHLQARIMKYLWLAEEGTVQSTMTACNQPRYDAGQPPLAYTTYLTVLRNLARRKFVEQAATGNGKAHIFKPLIERAEYRQRLAKYMLETYFDSDVRELYRALPEQLPATIG